MDIYEYSLNALLLAGACLNIQASGVDFDLEPRINGSLSASGQYESQALEDTANRNRDYAISFEENSIGDGSGDVIFAFGGNRDDFLR